MGRARDMQIGGDAVSATGVTKRYRRMVALDGFSISLPFGVVVGLAGTNGAGKTTALGILAGSIKPTTGQVRVMGSEPSSTALLGLVGVLPDGSPFPEDETVGRYLTYLANLQDLDDCARAVDVALEAIGDLSWKQQRFRDLSEGMRRQVGLAQAFLGNPRVVLLDEPTNGLDESALQALERLINNRRSRTTIVLASHDTGVLERWCDRVLRMTKGRIDARDRSPGSPSLEQGMA